MITVAEEAKWLLWGFERQAETVLRLDPVEVRRSDGFRVRLGAREPRGATKWWSAAKTCCI
jgi:hypothetical protein